LTRKPTASIKDSCSSKSVRINLRYSRLSPSSPERTVNDATRWQAIAIAAAIFAARDLAQLKDTRDPRAARAIEEAISKARYLIDVIDRKLLCIVGGLMTTSRRRRCHSTPRLSRSWTPGGQRFTDDLDLSSSELRYRGEHRKKGECEHRACDEKWPMPVTVIGCSVKLPPIPVHQ